MKQTLADLFVGNRLSNASVSEACTTRVYFKEASSSTKKSFFIYCTISQYFAAFFSRARVDATK